MQPKDAWPRRPRPEVERRTTTDEPPPEARAGEELGTVEVLVDGKSVGAPLVTEKGYEEAFVAEDPLLDLRRGAERLRLGLGFVLVGRLPRRAVVRRSCRVL